MAPAAVHRAARRWRAGAVGVALAAVLGCTAEPPSAPVEPPPSPAVTSASPPRGPAGSPTPSSDAPTPAGSADAESASARFSAARAAADVRHLAGRIGPRPATGPSFRRAADWVAARFRRLGYDVALQTFPVPAGDSWGVPVAAGRSSNVVATPPGFDAARPHRVLGAHLDTVAVAPGAEDNASGVAVVLELARLAARDAPALPTVFVAFGAEEPVGSGDALHHFGSRHYVAQMSGAQGRALRAMASFDRVGVGRVVPLCTGPLSPADVQRAVLRTARRLGVRVTACQDNTASDHWSFEKAGHSVVRFGSTPYAAYHSAADRPGVVAPAQLARTGRLAWAWLNGDRGSVPAAREGG